MCLYPKLVRNPKYKVNNKNMGNVPEPSDRRALWIPVKCNECIECKKKKANEWRIRLQEEIRHRTDGVFVTLTMSNETVRKYVHRIKKKARKQRSAVPEGYDMDYEIGLLRWSNFSHNFKNHFGRRPRYWCVTELGGEYTENLHFHAIIFEDRRKIKKAWGKDFVYFGYSCDDDAIGYITKYVYKQDPKHRDFKPKMYVSKGIGKNYLDRKDAEKNRFDPVETKEIYRSKNGVKQGLPQYYRNKLYSDDEREYLWMQKLDKKERFVLGQRVDVSTEAGIREYEKLVEEARAKNKRLGFGGEPLEYDRIYYEHRMRDLNLKKRL